MPPKSKHTPAAPHLPPLPAQAALSFLKDTKGALSWTAADFARTLNVSKHDADQAIAVLEAQGYVKPHGNEFMTTPAGASVSGAKHPRFAPDRVHQALDALAGRIKHVNKDTQAPFRITNAVAFGDFLVKDRARVQAADVGVRVIRREDKAEPRSFSDAREEQAFLKQLRARSSMFKLVPYSDWMSRRSHQKLL